MHTVLLTMMGNLSVRSLWMSLRLKPLRQIAETIRPLPCPPPLLGHRTWSGHTREVAVPPKLTVLWTLNPPPDKKSKPCQTEWRPRKWMIQM